MGLQKRNKVSAEFNMSSLTDIIFLLLIFFMLTSNFVKINLDLPESDSKTIAASSLLVEIDEDGNHKFLNRAIQPEDIKNELINEIATLGEEEKKDVTLTIAAEKNASFDYVADLIEIAGQLRIKAILATQAKKS